MSGSSSSRPASRDVRRVPATLYLANLAEGSRDTMRGALNLASRRLSGGEWSRRGGYWTLLHARKNHLTFNWTTVRHEDLLMLRGELAERYAPASVNKILGAVKGVLTHAFNMGLITAEHYLRVKNVHAIRSTRLMRGRALELSEIRNLLRACRRRPRRPVDARDAAVIAILYAGGLRRSELAKLALSDYEPKTGEVVVREGKGRKDRKLYISRGARSVVAGWLKRRGGEPGPLICPVGRTGRLEFRHLSGQAVMDILRRRALQAGVRPFTPHDLRRTFTTFLWDAGVDGVTIQRILGHASIETTARYDRRNEYATKAAAEKMKFPS